MIRAPLTTRSRRGNGFRRVFAVPEPFFVQKIKGMQRFSLIPGFNGRFAQRPRIPTKLDAKYRELVFVVNETSQQTGALLLPLGLTRFSNYLLAAQNRPAQPGCQGVKNADMTGFFELTRL
jgi:hypothetical protein